VVRVKVLPGIAVLGLRENSFGTEQGSTLRLQPEGIAAEIVQTCRLDST